jgi:hypothetical protein
VKRAEQLFIVLVWCKVLGTTYEYEMVSRMMKMNAFHIHLDALTHLIKYYEFATPELPE